MVFIVSYDLVVFHGGRNYHETFISRKNGKYRKKFEKIKRINIRAIKRRNRN